MSTARTLVDQTLLVTGANRGIGRALLEEALRRGARRVFAATRQAWAHPDGRVTRVTMDVTDPAQIRDAVRQLDSLDVLVNNAGSYALRGDDFRDRSLLERHLAVNLFGPYDVTEAFLPLLARSRGAVVNVLSLASLAGVPFTPAYAISKAAAFSLTQSLRTVLAARGVSVHAVFPGPVDTDMTRDLELPKVSADSVARAILDGLEKGDEDILPDPLSASVAESWRSGEAKMLERQFAAMTAGEQA
jgi:NAD(P)-dependent dehydrogenase (short-subunit alcohol dehydrogenase family)